MIKRRCDPSCGLGCTELDYDRERRKAKRICRVLGTGWRLHLWDNLGWHHEVISPDGHIRVSDETGATGTPQFWAYISDTQDQPFICWEGRGRTPQAAVQAAKHQLAIHIEDIRAQATQLAKLVLGNRQRLTRLARSASQH